MLDKVSVEKSGCGWKKCGRPPNECEMMVGICLFLSLTFRGRKRTRRDWDKIHKKREDDRESRGNGGLS